MDFLRPNARVQLKRPGTLQTYSSRIEDVGNDSFTVGAPLSAGQVVPVEVGQDLDVSVQQDTSLFQFTSRVLERGNLGNIPTLILSKPADIRKVQRRNFYRVKTQIPVHYRVLPEVNAISSDPFAETVSRDISGGGIMIAAPPSLTNDAILELLIDIPNPQGEATTITCVGRVVVIKGEGKDKNAGIEFEIIEEPDRERIIKYVFELQRKQMAKAREDR